MVLMLTISAAVPSGSARAQQDTLRLTRGDVRERAVANASDLTGRRAAVEEARRLAQRRYPFNPEVSVEAEGVSAPWSNREYTRRLRLEQEIDLRGERGARGRVGQATTAVAERELTESVQDISAQIDETYSRHLVARRKVEFLAPLRERAASLGSRAEAARRRETLTGFEARLLRAEALGLEADWVSARRELDVTSTDLRVWLMLPANPALDLEDDLDERPWRCQSDSALALAFRGRAALARAAASESLAMARMGLEKKLARANPSIAASVGRERLELEPDGGGLIHDEDTFVGLEVRMPIPIFARNQPGVAEATLEFERSRADRLALEREVRQEVVGACTALERAEEERRLRGEAAQSASQDLALIERAYADGRIPLDEYLTMRERLVRQQLALLDILGEVEAERAKLVRATGSSRADLVRHFGGER